MDKFKTVVNFLKIKTNEITKEAMAVRCEFGKKKLGVLPLVHALAVTEYNVVEKKTQIGLLAQKIVTLVVQQMFV